MSDMFDYNDVAELKRRAALWEPIGDKEFQEYALKYVFGLIDRERRLKASESAKCGKQSNENDRRIGMLKRLARTVSDISFET